MVSAGILSLMLLATLSSLCVVDACSSAVMELTRDVLPEVTVIRHGMRETVRSADDSEIADWLGYHQLPADWIRSTVDDIGGMAGRAIASRKFVYKSDINGSSYSPLTMTVGICEAARTCDHIEIAGRCGYFRLEIPPVHEWVRIAVPSRWPVMHRRYRYIARARQLTLAEFELVAEVMLDKVRDTYDV